MAPAPGDQKAGYELAFSEARRALDEQERAVSELRSRAGLLIGAAAISTSFFGGPLLAGGEVTAAGWTAIALFILLGACVLGILWPRRDWAFSLNPATFLETYLEPADRDEEPLALHLIHRDLALHMGASASRNRRALRLLQALFRLAAVLLVAETMAWVVALAVES